MPDLPTGTVTLLFTDIEGSTRLLQKSASTMAGGGVCTPLESYVSIASFMDVAGVIQQVTVSVRQMCPVPWGSNEWAWAKCARA